MATLLEVIAWNPNSFEAYIDGRHGTRRTSRG